MLLKWLGRNFDHVSFLWFSWGWMKKVYVATSVTYMVYRVYLMMLGVYAINCVNFGLMTFACGWLNVAHLKEH